MGLDIAGAILDMDGTILDSMDIWTTISSRYMRSRGVEPPETLSGDVVGLGMLGAAAHIRALGAFSETPEVIVRQINDLLMRAYAQEIPERPHVRDFLEDMQARGVPMCVATATDRPLAEAALRRLNLLGYFRCILTCSELGVTKQTPDIFEQALARLGTPKEKTPVVEDALHAIKTAKAAGFPIIGVGDAWAADHQARIRALSDLYLPDWRAWRGRT